MQKKPLTRWRNLLSGMKERGRAMSSHSEKAWRINARLNSRTALRRLSTIGKRRTRRRSEASSVGPTLISSTSSKSRWVRRGTGIGVPSNVMALSRERHDRIMLETATRDFHVAQQPQEIRFFGSSRTVRRRLLQRQMDYQSRSANSHMPGDEQHRMF